MDDMQLAELAAVRDVLVITSTFGDGGPPDNGAGFWDRLHSADAPALGGVRYAVLGIGDRSYANFCGHAKAIDGRFAALGATRMTTHAGALRPSRATVRRGRPGPWPRREAGARSQNGDEIWCRYGKPVDLDDEDDEPVA